MRECNILVVLDNSIKLHPTYSNKKLDLTHVIDNIIWGSEDHFKNEAGTEEVKISFSPYEHNADENEKSENVIHSAIISSFQNATKKSKQEDF